MLLLLLFPALLRASHLVGGEIYYKQIGSNQYRVTLKIYRDCNSINQQGTLTPFDVPAVVAIYQNGTLFSAEEFIPGVPTKIPVVVENPCLTAPPNICVDEATYEKTITLPVSTSDYVLTYQRCCRNTSIQNITGPAPFFSGSSGSTYTTTIPGSSKIPNQTNSSPEFANFPPLVICLNDNITFNHSAKDDDGDSLVYTLCDPYIGLTPGNPRPNRTNNLPLPPPYQPVPWSAGYSSSNPMNGSPPIAVDPRTGILTGSPSIQGQFVMAVCVREYRNGTLLSEVKRDFQFNVTFCNSKSVAAAASQESFCDGLEIAFQNQSSNAKFFEWDFGDPNSLTDTSTQRDPVYIYPDTGKYDITLIVNKGWPCADTTFTTYEVYNELSPSFKSIEGQCFNNHNFGMQAGGLFQEYARFEWDYGPYGNPSKSFVQNPSNIKFKQPGEHEIKLTVAENGCTGSYTDTIKVYPNPIAKFEVERNQGCIPHTVSFKDASTSWSDLEYLWDFGNGANSTEQSPSFNYTEPGFYDISLRIISDGICADTSYFKWDRIVKVNELPEAGLIISKRVVSHFNPVVEFSSNSSANTNRCKLIIGDGFTSGLCEYTHQFPDTGIYNIRQIAYTRYGCTDTVFDQVRVLPEPLFYIPNAFTPDGDKTNEIFRPEVFGAFKYHFQVINRWGEILYETNRIQSGWNGKLPNGKLAPVDAYVYRVAVKDAVGEEKEYRGVFQLIR